MKIRRTRKSKKGRIEIIPMIDVMFFLLATFMLASLSMQHLDAVPVNLAQGKAEKIQTEKQITLTITHDNSIFLNKEEIALSALFGRLQPLLESSEKTVIIASDKEAFQGVVMQVMLAARAAGARNFSMIVRN
jgi:biopolymer transport protein ExbD